MTFVFDDFRFFDNLLRQKRIYLSINGMDLCFRGKNFYHPLNTLSQNSLEILSWASIKFFRNNLDILKKMHYFKFTNDVLETEGEKSL